MDGKLKSIHGAWIPAQICLKQIYIDPKGRQAEKPDVNPCRNDDLGLCVYEI
jgi:hypothetical protein